MSRRASASVRWVLIILVLLGSVGAVYTLWKWMKPTVTITQVVRGPVVQAFYATGTVEPVRDFPIRTNVAGVVSQLYVDKGDAVEKDQILAVIHDPALQFALDRAQAIEVEKARLADEATSPVLQQFDAQLAPAREQLAIAQRELDRFRESLERGAATPTDIDRATDRILELRARIDSLIATKNTRRIELERELAIAQADVRTAQWNLDQLTLRSPVKGVVLDRPQSLGTRLEVNGELMRIANVAPDSLVLRASVDEEDITKVRDAQVVHIVLYAFANQTFDGRVVQIYPEADTQRRTFEVDVQLIEPNPLLQPGMTGELAFVMNSKDDAMVVPSQAVDGANVYTLEDGRIVRHDVKVGLRSVERTEILEGLSSDARVIISPVGQEMVGTFVKHEEIDPKTAAGLNVKEDEAMDGEVARSTGAI